MTPSIKILTLYPFLLFKLNSNLNNRISGRFSTRVIDSLWIENTKIIHNQRKTKKTYTNQKTRLIDQD